MKKHSSRAGLRTPGHGAGVDADDLARILGHGVRRSGYGERYINRLDSRKCAYVNRLPPVSNRG